MIAPSYHTIRKKGLVHLLKGGRERNRWVGGGGGGSWGVSNGLGFQVPGAGFKMMEVPNSTPLFFHERIG